MKRPNRNDLCYCGSGKKYKKCHLEQDDKLIIFEKQGFIVPSMSIIKNNEQISGIRESGKLTKEILHMVEGKIKEGITTNDINTWVHDYTIAHGAIPAPLNYQGFPKSVCTSINNVICHGIPDDTVLKNGDIINVDVTTILNGFYADASKTFVIGEASVDAINIVKAAEECLNIGINAIKPYGSLNDIGRSIQAYCDKHGYSIVRDLGGHGVGISFHEEPHVDHFERKEKGMLILPGMVFTVEPMINLGSYHCEVLEDEWTAITRDGSLSAQFEHTILVLEDGVEILT